MVAGTPGTEELSWEIVVTRKPQPSSPTSSSACCLFSQGSTPNDSVGSLPLSQVHGGNVWSTGLHGSSCPAEIKGIATSLWDTPQPPRSLPPPLALACRRWPAMLWKDCALPWGAVWFALGSLSSCLRSCRNSQ